jgi:hypothetical protein
MYSFLSSFYDFAQGIAAASFFVVLRQAQHDNKKDIANSPTR